MMLATIDTALGLHRAGLTARQNLVAPPLGHRARDGKHVDRAGRTRVRRLDLGGSGDDARAAEIWACVDRTAADAVRVVGPHRAEARPSKTGRRRSPDAFEPVRIAPGTALNDIADAVRTGQTQPGASAAAVTDRRPRIAIVGAGPADSPPRCT